MRRKRENCCAIIERRKGCDGIDALLLSRFQGEPTTEQFVPSLIRA